MAAKRGEGISFEEEEVELTLSPPGRRTSLVTVSARYIFLNHDPAPWRGRIAYPIWVAPWQPAPAAVQLADGRRLTVRCLTNDYCATSMALSVRPYGRTELALRYHQRLKSGDGRAVYLLTSGATWSRPIGRVRLRVLVPAGYALEASYPLELLGRFRGAGQRYDVYESQQEQLSPREELRVGLRPRLGAEAVVDRRPALTDGH